MSGQCARWLALNGVDLAASPGSSMRDGVISVSGVPNDNDVSVVGSFLAKGTLQVPDQD
jgi:hypothetical protein